MRNLITVLEALSEYAGATPHAHATSNSAGTVHGYSMLAKAFCSIAMTSVGSFAYERASTMF